MSEYIPPLQMETIIKTLFAGSPDIFMSIAILAIFILAGVFKMNMLATFLIIGIFLLMFSSFISSPLIILIAILGGLLIGYTISKVFGQ